MKLPRNRKSRSFSQLSGARYLAAELAAEVEVEPDKAVLLFPAQLEGGFRSCSSQVPGRVRGVDAPEGDWLHVLQFLGRVMSEFSAIAFLDNGSSV